MTETITLELPDALVRKAKAEAERSNRTLEAVLLDWLSQAEQAEPPVETLSDAEVLALSQAQMVAQQSEELSELLARSREGQLDEVAQRRLDALMQIYRTGLVRKAQALKVAVERGLTAPLN